MQNERQLQEYTKKQAKIFDIGYYKLACIGKTGFPDVMLAYNGHSIYIELKSPSGKGVLGPRQKIMIAELSRRGLTVYVAKDKETIDLIISQLIKREPGTLH